jgi:hypothetical protein
MSHVNVEIKTNVSETSISFIRVDVVNDHASTLMKETEQMSETSV